MFCCRVNELCPGTSGHILLFLCSLGVALLQSKSHLMGCFCFSFHGFLSIHRMPGCRLPYTTLMCLGKEHLVSSAASLLTVQHSIRHFYEHRKNRTRIVPCFNLYCCQAVKGGLKISCQLILLKLVVKVQLTVSLLLSYLIHFWFGDRLVEVAVANRLPITAREKVKLGDGSYCKLGSLLLKKKHDTWN